MTRVAGPIEAPALRNLFVQARALGLVEGGLAELRILARAAEPVRRFDAAPTA